MLKVLTIGAALLCAATTTAAQAQGALGASFNDYADLDYREIDKTGARWIHLTALMPQMDRGAANNGPIRTILDASSRGYSTMLSLRFPFNDRDFPAIGGPDLAREFARLDAVLPLVMGKVDMLVIGAEPYVESRIADRDLDLNAFYEALAARVIAYRAANCPGSCRTRLYMGGLNRLDIKSNQTASTERWMAFVKATPELDGVSFRMHLPSLEASRAFVNYTTQRMRADQKFVVPEFSLIWWWMPNMKTSIPASFADKYQAPRNAQTWQIVRAALETPFSKAQWDEFMSQTSWIDRNKHYLRDQMKILRDTGRLAVAGYGFKQGKALSADFTDTRFPWLFNSIYADRTAKRNPDGSAAFNYVWIDDFKALQR
ncbi:MAG TPA: hypothetical protein VN029_05460 [Sphingomonas sp.]|nr:hypothetical protein [Sphingomonas sp.]